MSCPGGPATSPQLGDDGTSGSPGTDVLTISNVQTGDIVRLSWSLPASGTADITVAVTSASGFTPSTASATLGPSNPTPFYSFTATAASASATINIDVTGLSGSASNRQAIYSATCSRTGTTGSIGTSPNPFNVGSAITVSVTDNDLNSNSSTAQTVSVTVQNTTTSESESLTLTETGANTGVFSGNLTTVFGNVAGTNNNGSMNVQGGQVLSASYNDAKNAAGNAATVTSTTTAQGGVNGSVTITPNPFNVGSSVTVQVTDADQNTASGSAQTVSVTVSNGTTGESEALTLTETGNNTGIFRTTLTTAFGSGAGTNNSAPINVQSGQVLTASYTDTLTTSGSSSATRTATTTAQGGTNGTVSVTPGPFNVGSAVTVQVTDADRNIAAGSAQTVSVTVTNGTTGESEALTLTETGNNTGIFSASLTTAFGNVAGTNNSSPINVQSGQVLTASYTDTLTTSGTSSATRTGTATAQGGVNGTVSITPNPFNVASAVTLQVTDADRNTAAGSAQTVSVTVTNGTTGESEAVTLTETGNDTGIFSANLATAFGNAAGTNNNASINVQSGQVLTATYTDSLTTSGSSAASRTATATAQGGVNGTVAITPNPFNVGSAVTVQVTDADRNTAAGSAQTVSVTVTNGTTGESEALTLTETGNNTGIFSTTLTTAFGNSAGTNNSAPINVQSGQVLTASYTDALTTSGTSSATRTATTAAQGGTNGTVNVTPNPFNVGTAVTVQVTDADQNTASGSLQTVTATVTNGTTGEQETLTLTETGNNTGIFSATLTTTFGNVAGTNNSAPINVQSGQVLTASYTDTLTTSGTSSATRTGTATARGGVNGTVAITPAPFNVGSAVTVQVSDADQNTLAGSPQTVTVTVTNGATGESEALTLTETGNDTGIFNTTLATAFGNAAGINNSASINVQTGQVLTATYTDALTTSGASSASRTGTATAQGGTNGTVSITPNPFNVGGAVTVQVIDADRNTAAGTAQTVNVTVTNSTTGEQEALTLAETGNNTGTFSATLTTAFGNAAGTNNNAPINVQSGQVLSASYTDTLTTSGTSSATRNGTATAQGGTNGTVSITPDPFNVGSTISVQVTDPDQNTASGSAQTVAVTVTNGTTGEQEALILTETGNNTGTFSAALTTAFGNVAGTNNNAPINIQGGEALTASYTDTLTTSGASAATRTSTATAQGGTNGTVGISPNPFNAGSTVSVQVSDADRNTTAGALQTVNVTVTNWVTSESETLTLTETGNDTGVFSASLPTAFGNAAGVDNSGSMNVQNGQVLTASYTDVLTASGSSSASRTAAATAQGGTDGTVSITPDPFGIGNDVTLQVIDADRNAAPGSADTVSVMVANSTTGESETLTLAETGNDTGIFSATLATAFGNAAGSDDSGSINVQNGQQVAVSYTDALTTSGSSSATRTVAATAQGGTNASVGFSSASFTIGDTLTVEVADADRNTAPGTIETLTVTIGNPATGESETITLTETSVDSGLFSGSISTALGAGVNPTAGVINAKGGDTLALSYLDSLTTGSASATRTASTSAISSPGRSISKTVDVANLAAPGLLTYTITVVNVGNVPLTLPNLTDSLSQNGAILILTSGPTLDSGDDGDGVLGLGETWTYKATYQVTQANIDDGTDIQNTATFDDDILGPISATASSTITRTSDFTVAKSVDLTTVTGPSLLTYTITIANSGNTTLTGLSLTESLAQDGNALSLTFGPALDSGDDGDGLLEVGESWIYKATYQTTQGNVDNGADIVNTVSFDTAETGAKSASATTAITRVADFIISKSVDTPNLTGPGLLTYAITVANSGNVTLTGLSLTDSLAQDGNVLSLSSAPVLDSGDDGDGLLEVGESWIYKTTYQATQANIDSGADIMNSASFDTDQTTAKTASVSTTITRTPDFTIGKTVDTPNLTAPGLLTYAITVANSGNTTLTGMSLSDSVSQGGNSLTLTASPTLDSGDDGDGLLEVGESWIYKATYQATQANIDDGADIVNTASFDTGQTASKTASATTTITQNADFTIGKTVDAANLAAPGVLTYTITVANTGNRTLTGPALTDDLAQDGDALVLASLPALESGDDGDGLLEVGESWAYKATYQATQATIDNGADIVNTASFDTDQTGSKAAIATTTITQTPDFTISKSVDTPNLTTPGLLAYTITVANTGNRTLTGVTLSDSLAQDGSALSLTSAAVLDSGDDGDGLLDVGESWIYKATYQATQANIDNGADIVNTASFDTDQTGSKAASATTTITQTPDFTISKSVDMPDLTAPGVLAYTITVANTGNTTLTGVVLADDLAQDGAALTLTAAPVLDSGDDGDGLLEVGESWIYKATYQATQANIDNGADIVNTASFDTDQTGSKAASATTTITRTPDFTISKSVDTPSLSAPGILAYTITVANTGNTTLTGAALTDTLAQDGNALVLTSAATLDSGDDGDSWLEVGESWVYKATYQATQAIIDNGADIVNTASFDTDQTSSKVASATTTITQIADFTISKSVDTPNLTTPGVLTYTITVANSGNLTLTGTSLTDDLTQDGNALTLTSGPALDSGDDGDGLLDVGEVWTYSAIYQTTQANIDAGADIVNTASFDTAQTAEKSAVASTTITQTVDFTISKAVDASNLVSPSLLTYTITIVNSGNTTLTGLSLTDSLAQGGNNLPLTSGPSLYSGDDGDGLLEVGESWIYEATYQATQANIDDGGDLVNSASFDTDQTAAKSAGATTTITQTADFTISKDVDVGNLLAPGPLTYTITVVNSGNITLTGLSLTDNLVQDGNSLALSSAPALDSGDDGDGLLEVGESWIYKASYLATQANMDNGANIINTVSFDSAQTGAKSADVTTTVMQAPDFNLAMAVDTPNLTAPGLLTYTITVTNSGSTTLTGLSLADSLVQDGNSLTLTSAPMLSTGDDGDGMFEVGESWVYQATYQVTQANVDNGADIVSTVSFDSTQTAAKSAQATTTIAQTSDITISKAVNIANLTAPGLLSYTITVANSGNTTLTTPVLTDTLQQNGNTLTLTSGPTLDSGDDGDDELDAGETWIYKATYQVSQADIDASADVVNTASFDTAQTGAKSASATTTLTPASGFTLVTDVAEATYEAVGDVLHYTITITNNAGVTLTGIILSDALTTDEACPGTTLAPSASMQCTASYTIVQADLDTGSVTNSASVDTDQTAAQSDDATSTANQSPALTVSKTSSSHFSKAGDMLDYSFVVTNSGNTTLTNVTLADPLISNAAIPGCDYQELATGAEMTCTGQYTVTQADVDAGQVTNTATAAGSGPSGEITASDTITITITPGPSDAEVAADFKALTGSFIAHRIDRIVESEPDVSRFRNRLADERQAGLVANLQGAGGALDGTVSMSVQGLRVKVLQLAGEGLPEPQERNWIDRFDIWVEGKFSTYADPNDDDDLDGQFGIVHTGADYRITEDVLLGFMASVDWTDETTDEGEVKGDGWMAGPYISARLSPHLFFDARAAWGRSSNNAKQTIMGLDYEGDFDTERWLARASLSGNWEIEDLVLSPEIAVAYVEETQESYDVGNGVDAVAVSGQTVSVGRLSVGQEIGYRYELETMRLSPYLRANLHWDFKEAESFILADDSEALDGLTGGGELGLRFQSDGGISGSLAVSYDGLFSNDVEALGVKGGLAVSF